MLYTRNQFFALAGFICFVEVLEFLNIHHLFGPWAIIITNMFHDLMRYLVILALFISGFTIVVWVHHRRPLLPLLSLVTVTPCCSYSIFIPAYAPTNDKLSQEMNDHDILDTFRTLYFALFQLVSSDDMPDSTSIPGFAASYFRFIFGLYMMVGFVVLINLLIAMMTNTYERIHARSDTVRWSERELEPHCINCSSNRLGMEIRPSTINPPDEQKIGCPHSHKFANKVVHSCENRYQV